MSTVPSQGSFPPIRSRAYWRAATRSFANLQMLVFAAMIVALRVAVKLFRVPLAAGLSLSFDCYVNALGSVVYGPLMSLVVGAVSDTIGCIIAPNGPYFPPFMLVEMTSSFLFALFFWKKELTLPRIVAAKFTVNLLCNVIMTSLFMKWSYLVFYGVEKAQGYAIINLVRTVKSLVMFPVEATLIALVLRAAAPALHSFGLLVGEPPRLRQRDAFVIVGFFLLSVALVLFYIFFLKDFVSAHNWKLF